MRNTKKKFQFFLFYQRNKNSRFSRSKKPRDHAFLFSKWFSVSKVFHKKKNVFVKIGCCFFFFHYSFLTGVVSVLISGYSNLAPSSQVKCGQHDGNGAVLFVLSVSSLHLSLANGSGPQSSTNSNNLKEEAKPQWNLRLPHIYFVKNLLIVVVFNACWTTTEWIEIPGFADFVGTAFCWCKACSREICIRKNVKIVK